MVAWLINHTPLIFMTQSFWSDEAFSYLVAARRISEIITISANDFGPPLFYLILHFWIKIVDKSEVLLRALPLTFFVLSVYVFSIYIEKILKVKGKLIWIYSLLFLLNPFLLYFAFELRSYSLFLLLTLTSFYFFQMGNFKKYVLFSIMGLYTHYFFSLVLLTQLILVNLNRNKASFSARGVMVPLLFFLPWIFYSLPKVLKNIGPSWIPRMTFKEFVTLPGILFTGYETYFWNYYDKYMVPLTVFIVFFFVVYFKLIKPKKTHLQSTLIVWALIFFSVTALISFIWPIFVPRYLIFAPAGFLLLLVHMMEKFSSGKKIIFLTIFFLLTFHNLNLQFKKRKKDNLRNTFKIINSSKRADDLVYVKNATLYFPAVFYLGENRVFIYGTPQEVPYYIGGAMISEEKILLTLPIYPKKAFILTGPENFDIKSTL